MKDGNATGLSSTRGGRQFRDSMPATPALARLRAPVSGDVLSLWDGSRLFDLTEFQQGRLARLDLVLQLPLAIIRDALEAALRIGLPELDPGQSELYPPAESQEIWAAGVTYERSRQARIEETSEPDVYTQVYQATRPELFFKAAGWRVVGDGGRIGIRSDSQWNVPEPELAVLANSSAEILGYACGNDMSSRSIEGENPLYLPQAKVYRDSCSLGPAIALAWYVDVKASAIRLRISRSGQIVYDGESTTALLVRDPGRLVKVLYSSYDLPHGAWLLTGTPIVPGEGYTCMAGDAIEISIERVGKLFNLAYLVDHSGAEALPLTASE